MTETRDSAEFLAPNIETLEERRFLSSAVSSFAGCAPAEATPAASKTMTMMSLTVSSVQVSSAQVVSAATVTTRAQVIAPAARLAAEAALLRAMAQMAAIEQQMIFPGMQSGGIVGGSQDIQYGSRGMISRGDFDRDGDSHSSFQGGWGGDRRIVKMMPPPSYSQGDSSNDTGDTTTETPAVTTPQTPASSGSSGEVVTAPTAPAAPSVTGGHVTTQHVGANTPASTAVAAILPPKAFRATVGSTNELTTVIDTLATTHAGVTVSSMNMPTGESSIRPFGAMGGLFSKTSITYAEAASLAARAARAVEVITADALPAMARTIGNVVQTAMASPRQVLRFERMSDPMMLIGDAYAAFAEESSFVATAVARPNPYARAWNITGVVAAIDTAALVYWVQTRRRRRAEKAAKWAFEQAGGEVA